jgi:hypothetical protein
MAAFNNSPLSSQQPDPSPDQTGVVGKWEQLKELQRARLAGYASDVPYSENAPSSAGVNAALTPPAAPMMGQAPQPMPAQAAASPMAEGRIVTKPTLAVLGEGDSPEMVVPLNNAPDNKTNLSNLMPHGRYRRQ